MDIKTEDYFPHRVFLCALFLVGNAVIYFPKTADGVCGIYGFLIASALGIVFAGAISFILKKAETLIKGESIKKTVSVMLVLIFLMLFSVTSAEYVVFTDSTKMPNTSTALIAEVFAVLSIYCGYCSKSTLFRLSVICFLICAFIILMLLLLLLPQSQPVRLLNRLNFKGILSLMLSAFLPTFAAYFFIESEKGCGAAITGTALGSFILFICYFICTAVLGVAVSEVPYPLAAVSGITSFGGGFSRYEGFIYLMLLLTCFIKCSVLANLIGYLGE